MALYSITYPLIQEVSDIEMENDESAYNYASSFFISCPDSAKMWDMPRVNGGYSVRVATREKTILIIEKKVPCDSTL